MQIKHDVSFDVSLSHKEVIAIGRLLGGKCKVLGVAKLHVTVEVEISEKKPAEATQP